MLESGDGMTLEQKRKIAELLPNAVCYVDSSLESLKVKVDGTEIGWNGARFIDFIDGLECWPLIGALVEECERRGWYWRLLPSHIEVSDRILTVRKPRTKTEAFCLAFLAAVEAVA